MDQSAPDAAPNPLGNADPTGLDDGVRRVFGESASLAQAAPDYLNDQRLLEVVKEFKTEALDARWVYERAWWRNLLYLLGRQWIYYDKRRGQWQDKRMVKWTPRPVTNKIAETHEAICALLSSIKLGALVRPVGNESGQVATAELADGIAPFIHQGHGMDGVLREGDFWLVACGNTILHSFWDKSEEWGEVLVPFERCAGCGETMKPGAKATMCPTCRGTAFLSTGEDGAPLTQAYPQGKGRTIALSPFEIAVPPMYATMEAAPGLIRLHWRPKRYYDDRYPEMAKKMSWEKAPQDRSLQLLRTLATQSDVSSLPLSYLAGAGVELQSQGMTEYEMWLKPTKEWPEGLFVRQAGDGPSALIVRDEDESVPGPLPYQTRDGRPLFPWLHVGYRPFGGRLWARGPLDLVIQKQDQINQLDSLTQMIVTRVANPLWTVPKGAEVSSFTGEPGLVVYYNALVAGGTAKPERVAGENIPVTLFQLRQQYLTDFEQLSGTFDALKGSKPSGVEAFSAMQLLVERGMARFATVFAERGEAYRKWYELALELERQFGPEQRTMAVLKPNRGWSFRHFQNADLQGAVEIIVEDGTQAPKTALGERAAIEQANNLKLLDPTNPETKYQMLQTMGLTKLVPSLDSDIKSALREQDEYEVWGSNLNLSDPAVVQQATVQYQQQTAEYQAFLVQQQAVEQEQANQAQMINVTRVPGQPPVQPPALPPPPAPRLMELSPFQWQEQHNDQVHFAEHRKWGNSDIAIELFKNRPDIQVFYTYHLRLHKEKIQEAATGQAEPMAPVTGAGQAMRQSNTESGNPADVPRGQGLSTQKRGPE